MVSLHRLYHTFTNPKFLQDSPLDFDVCARYLMVYRLPNVMKEATCTSDGHVGAEFFREHACNMRNLH
jgi:hypothetical protein